MAGSVNRVILVGNLGRDPEIRRTQMGDPIASLSLATSDTWRDKQSGERREKTEWHRVVVFGKLAEIVERYMMKGSKLYVEGQLKTRKWQDQGGAERYTTEVVVSGFGGQIHILGGGRSQGDGSGGGYDNGGSPSGGNTGGGGGTNRYGPTPGPGLPGSDDLDDEIPF